MCLSKTLKRKCKQTLKLLPSKKVQDCSTVYNCSPNPGLLKKLIKRLQLLQTAAVWVLTGTCNREHITTKYIDFQ